jgi:hypothetical protein
MCVWGRGAQMKLLASVARRMVDSEEGQEDATGRLDATGYSRGVRQWQTGCVSSCGSAEPALVHPPPTPTQNGTHQEASAAPRLRVWGRKERGSANPMPAPHPCPAEVMVTANDILPADTPGWSRKMLPHLSRVSHLAFPSDSVTLVDRLKRSNREAWLGGARMEMRAILPPSVEPRHTAGTSGHDPMPARPRAGRVGSGGVGLHVLRRQ